MTILFIFLFVVSIIVLTGASLSYIAFGIFYLRSAPVVCAMFALSVFLLIFGTVVLFFAPKYTQRQYLNWLKRDDLNENVKSKNIFKVLLNIVCKHNRVFFFSCFTLGVILILVPYANWDKANGVLDFISILRLTMQMFVVDGGISDFIGESGCNLPVYINPLKDGIGLVYFNCHTALFCIAAGLLFAFNILNIFAKDFFSYLKYWWGHPFSEVYVMSELNEKSIVLAESILLKHNQIYGTKDYKEFTKYIKVYFCDVYSDNQEISSELIYRAKRLGAVIMKRDITEIKIKLLAKGHIFYLIGQDEEENVIQAKKIKDAYLDKLNNKVYSARRFEMYIFASRPEHELVIDSINKQIWGKIEDYEKRFYDINYTKLEKLNTKIKELNKSEGSNVISKYERKKGKIEAKIDQIAGEGYNVPLRIRRIDEHYRFALDFFWDEGKSFFESVIYKESLNYEQKDNIDSNLGDKTSSKILKYKIIKVAFVGFGEYAYELLKVLCSLGQLPNCRLIIHIYDHKAKNIEQKFQKELLDHRSNIINEETNNKNIGNIKYHDIPFYEIHFKETDVEKNKFIDKCLEQQYTHLFFILGNDGKNINMSTKVSGAFANTEKGFTPKLYVMVKNDDTVKQIVNTKFCEAYPNITFMGSNEERFSHNVMEESELEKMGLRVHRNYALYNGIADLFEEVDEEIEKIINIKKICVLRDSIKQFITENIKKYCYLIKEELRKLWRDHNAPNYKYIEQLMKLIDEFTVSDFDEELSLLRNNEEEINDESATLIRDAVEEGRSNIRLKVRDKLKIIWNPKMQEKDFLQEEYYRRSSKSRALFERLLYELGYLNYNKEIYLSKAQKDDATPQGMRVYVKNVVAEYGISDQDWKLQLIDVGDNNHRIKSENCAPSEILFYKKYETEIKQLTSVSEDAIEDPHDFKNVLRTYGKLASKPKINHRTKQWFEVNNILQKRWMVFRWSEGYRYGISGDKLYDSVRKTHKCLLPYVYIYYDDDKFIRHTIDVMKLNIRKDGHAHVADLYNDHQ